MDDIDFDEAWRNEQGREDVELSEDRDAVCDLHRVIEDILDATYDDPRACAPAVQNRLHQLGSAARLLGCALEGGDVARARPEDYKTVRRARRR